MTWCRHGFILKPSKKFGDETHCMVPTPFHKNDDLYIIYFSSRDCHNRSHVYYVIVSLVGGLAKVESRSFTPLLSPGRRGCFDDSGVTPSSIIFRDGKYFLYYIGWNPGSTTRVNLFGGLALSDSLTGPFIRYSEAPILERTPEDPILNTAPFVPSHDKSRMFYVSGVSWEDRDNSRYHLKEAFSNDGKIWSRVASPIITFREKSTETNFARPYLTLTRLGYERLWFSVRGGSYRIESALRDNGQWKREGLKYGLAPLLRGGVEDEMVGYGAVVTHKDIDYMFYNGNGFGVDGLLYASRESLD